LFNVVPRWLGAEKGMATLKKAGRWCCSNPGESEADIPPEFRKKWRRVGIRGINTLEIREKWRRVGNRGINTLEIREKWRRVGIRGINTPEIGEKWRRVGNRGINTLEIRDKWRRVGVRGINTLGFWKKWRGSESVNTMCYHEGNRAKCMRKIEHNVLPRQ
jgi:hypothetical protein